MIFAPQARSNWQDGGGYSGGSNSGGYGGGGGGGGGYGGGGGGGYGGGDYSHKPLSASAPPFQVGGQQQQRNAGPPTCKSCGAVIPQKCKFCTTCGAKQI